MKSQRDIVNTLYQLNINNIKTNELLKNHSSIKTGGPANIFIDIKNQKQLSKCVDFFSEINYQYVAIGNGTNVLFGDNGFKGAVLSLRKLKKHKICENGIYAQAGVGLFELNKLCRKYGFCGLEFSYGIPGSVGGAVCMNAGAYGHNLGEFVEYVYVLTNGKIKKISGNKLGFGYRNSIIQNSQMIVVGVKFNLKKGNNKDIEIQQIEYFQKRLQTQPYTEPSLGSTFKRQDGFLPVSKLIDELGLKGYKIGGACVSEKHAGFIVNKGSATCQDCLNLIKYVQAKVEASYGFVPQLEIKLLGD